MAALATDDLARLVPRRLATRHRRAARGPRAGDRPAPPDDRRAPRPTTSRAPPRPRRPPSRPGPRRATRSAPGSCAARPRSTRRNRDEFGTWTQRETGAVPQQDAPRVRTSPTTRSSTRRRCRPSRTARSCRRPCKGRLSMVRRVPVGVIGAITPWNSPSRAGHARRRAGPRARQRRRPQAGPADAGRRRGDVRRGLRARRACPRACSRSSSAAPTSARRSSPTRTSRSCRSPGRRPSGGGSASWPAACSRRSRWSSAATTRSSSSTTPTSTPPPSAGAFSAFQFQGQVCFAAGRHLVHRSVADAYIEALTEKARRLRHGRPVPRGRRSWARSSTRSSSPASTASSSARSRPGPSSTRAATHEGLFYRPTVLDRRSPRTCRPSPTRSSARSPRSRSSTPTRRRSPSPTPASTGSSASIYTRSISRGLALADRMRTGMVHVNDGTLNDEAIIPFGGMGDSGNGSRYGGEASLDTFTEWQWVTVRDEPPTFPF